MNVLPNIVTSPAPGATEIPQTGIQGIKQKVEESNTQMTQAFAGLLIASMGFMAAMAWNDAAKSYFAQTPLSKWTKFGPLIFAICATVFAFVVSKIMSKYAAPACTTLCQKTIDDLAAIVQKKKSAPRGQF
jgi:hypothetical protein